jgi:ribosome recycling factor
MLAFLTSELQKVEDHLLSEFSKLQVGRANPAIVEGIFISVYGSMQSLRSVASVSVMDAQTITIQPWDKSLIRDIDRAITEANLGLNPQNNGESIMIKIPTLTEERRKDLIKIAKRLFEESKIALRNTRADAMKKIKAAETAKTIGEDVAKWYETDLQKQIDVCSGKLEVHMSKKEVDIMKV